LPGWPKETRLPPVGSVGRKRPGYHQPGRNLGHDCARRTARNQAVLEAGRVERPSPRLGRPLRGRVLLAHRPDERRPGRRGRALRTPPPRPDLPVPGTTVLAPALLAERSAGPPVGPGRHGRALRVPDRPDALQSAGRHHREHLQQRQSHAPATPGGALQQIQTRPQALPLLRDGIVAHARRGAHPVPPVLLHPGLLRPKGHPVPQADGTGGRPDPRVAAAGRGGRRGAGRHGVRRRSDPGRVRRAAVFLGRPDEPGTGPGGAEAATEGEFVGNRIDGWAVQGHPAEPEPRPVRRPSGGGRRIGSGRK
jgi:hypothetical protein